MNIVNNLIKIISFEISNDQMEVKYQKVIKTNIKYPVGYRLVSKTTNVGDFGLDLSAAENYSKDLFSVNIGTSPDGYIQYAITEYSERHNGHALYLIFVKSII